MFITVHKRAICQSSPAHSLVLLSNILACSLLSASVCVCVFVFVFVLVVLA